jgi:Protein of unknown function (DUF2911)
MTDKMRFWRTRAAGAAIVLLADLASLRAVAAVVEMPPRAPNASLSQDVGLTRIRVDYRSPGVRGRAIWGARVPWGEAWRAGDSPDARISFDREVELAGQPVAAGTWTLTPVPAPDAWTFLLARADGAGAGAVPTAVRAAVTPNEPRERLRFEFSRLTNEDAVLELEWAGLRVSLPIAVHTERRILSDIEALDAAAAKAPPTLGTEPVAPVNGRHAPSDRGLERPAPRVLSKAGRAPAPDELGPTLKKGRQTIETCYQQSLRRDPTLASGRIGVSIAVGEQGLVKSVVLDAPEALRTLEPCVRSAVLHLVFPPSPAEYAVEVPLVLRGRD